MDMSSDTLQGSAMLQIHAAFSGDGKTDAALSDVTDKKVKVGTSCELGALETTHLLKSQACLPSGLPETYLQSLRRHAALLSSQKGKLSSEATETESQKEKIFTNTSADPSTASLDAAGFKVITSLCCPTDMETFFNRLLADRNLQVCSKPHVQGLVHWFSCVPDMDFNYVLDIIDNGNPCKFWATIGSTCPTLSAECEGKWCR